MVNFNASFNPFYTVSNNMDSISACPCTCSKCSNPSIPVPMDTSEDLPELITPTVERDPALDDLLSDPEFIKELLEEACKLTQQQ